MSALEAGKENAWGPRLQKVGGSRPIPSADNSLSPCGVPVLVPMTLLYQDLDYVLSSEMGKWDEET